MSTPDYKDIMASRLCPDERDIKGKYWQRTKTCEILKAKSLTWREKYVKYIILLLKMHQGNNKSIFGSKINKNWKVRDVLYEEFPFLKWGRRYEFGNPVGKSGQSGQHSQDMLSSGKKIYPKFFTYDNGYELFNNNSFEGVNGKTIKEKNLYEYLAEQMVAFKEKNPYIKELEYLKDIPGYKSEKGGRKRRTRRRRTKKKRRKSRRKRKRTRRKRRRRRTRK
tara:strand:- start:561 stop:1226 length:666 start_codon:yes stop_codon:yes gene_type:complete